MVANVGFVLQTYSGGKNKVMKPLKTCLNLIEDMLEKYLMLNSGNPKCQCYKNGKVSKCKETASLVSAPS